MNNRENQNTIKEQFHTQLREAITNSGGINLVTEDGDLISNILLSHIKGVYAIQDGEMIKIESLLQDTDTGEVKAYNQEFGEMNFNFEFVGSKSKCYEYLQQQRECLAIEVAQFVVTNSVESQGK